MKTIKIGYAPKTVEREDGTNYIFSMAILCHFCKIVYQDGFFETYSNPQLSAGTV
jgi:hypothetical protein